MATSKGIIAIGVASGIAVICALVLGAKAERLTVGEMLLLKGAACAERCVDVACGIYTNCSGNECDDPSDCPGNEERVVMEENCEAYQQLNCTYDNDAIFGATKLPCRCMWGMSDKPFIWSCHGNVSEGVPYCRKRCHSSTP
jgi:hypothetical protein